jgi:hypothetical protein
MAASPTYSVGKGSHLIEFEHRECGTLRVYTGMDEIGWGYSLNVADWDTYAGQVVQILSCYVEDVTISGTLQSYADLEVLTTYFLTYFQVASQGDRVNPIPGKTSYNQEPMTMRYAHRGWEFKIMPTSLPGFRIGREVVAPEWRVQAHMVDDEGDVEDLGDLILKEVEIRAHLDTEDGSLDTNFGLTGVIRFVDENPFSDPFTRKGVDFENKTLANRADEIATWYNHLLPSYLKGDFDAITGQLGSKPAFGNQDSSKDEGNKFDKMATKGRKK